MSLITEGIRNRSLLEPGYVSFILMSVISLSLILMSLRPVYIMSKVQFLGSTPCAVHLSFSTCS